MLEVENKVFMFTGRLCVTRSIAQSKVAERGGIIGSSLGYGTDYLVVGEDAGSKYYRAKELGTTILTETEFWALLKHPSDREAELEVPLDASETKWILEDCMLQFECDNCGFTWKSTDPTKDKCFICSISTKSANNMIIDNRSEGVIYSWYDTEMLGQLMRAVPRLAELLILLPIKCPICSGWIPYSVYSSVYFCPTCCFYLTPTSEGYSVGFINSPADLYSLSYPMLRLGWPIFPGEKNELGQFMSSSDGTSIFCTFSELDTFCKSKENRRLYNSAELLVSFMCSSDDSASKSEVSCPTRPSDPACVELDPAWHEFVQHQEQVSRHAGKREERRQARIHARRANG